MAVSDAVTVRGLSSIRSLSHVASLHPPITITLDTELGSQFFILTETAPDRVLISVPGGDPRGRLPGLPSTPRSIAEAVGLLVLAMGQSISMVNSTQQT